MGISSSKHKNRPYPFPMPNTVGYPQAPPQQYPPGFVPGFVPTGYGQAPQFPQPQLSWPNPTQQKPERREKKRKKKKSKKRAKYPNGYMPGPATGYPTQAVRQSSRDETPPFIPPGVSVPPSLFTPTTGNPLSTFPTSPPGGRRAATPFVPFSSRRDPDDSDEDSDDDSDEEEERPTQQSHSRRNSSRQPNPTSNVVIPPPGQIHTQPSNSRPQPDNSQFIHPVEPARPGVYGPPGARPPALRNPLPPPPRDLYEMTPYKQLLNLPQTTALLTATYGNVAQQQHVTVQPQANVAPAASTERKKSIRKGLLRAFSSRRNDNVPAPAPPRPSASLAEPNIRFIPVFVPAPQGNSTQTQAASETQPNTQTQPQPQTFTAPQTSTQAQAHWARSENSSESSMYYPHHPDRGPASGAHADNTSFPPPPVFHESTVGSNSPEDITRGPPPPVSTIRFDQRSKYAGFMNHSPHRVIHQNKIYPSATNLHEAMKYLDRRPEVAEMIRLCNNIPEVYPLSAHYQQYQREDWSEVFLKCMEEVLYLKFKQHPDLRRMLLATAENILVYADPHDNFWGEGPLRDGANELGKALVGVRSRLRAEGHYSHPAPNSPNP